jgi:hypothetical protein
LFRAGSEIQGGVGYALEIVTYGRSGWFGGRVGRAEKIASKLLNLTGAKIKERSCL